MYVWWFFEYQGGWFENLGFVMLCVVFLDKKFYFKFFFFIQVDDIMVWVIGFLWSVFFVLGGIVMFSFVLFLVKENQGLIFGCVKLQWFLCEFERLKKKD